VSGFRLSKSAQADIDGIGIYTRDRWDENQATRYLTALDGCFHRIAEHPLLLGHACDDIRPGYRRAEQGSHVVFYKLDENGLLIVRVLHRKMLPKRHLKPADENE
jgi:toxin ParE1/3/4